MGLDVMNIKDLKPTNWLLDSANNDTLSMYRHKLSNNIKKYGQITLPIVYQSDKGSYIVTVGARELDAYQQAGIDKIYVQFLGKISDEEAHKLMFSLAFNHIERDELKMSALVTVLLEKFTAADIANCTKYNSEEILALKELLEFDWGKYREVDGNLGLFDKPEEKEVFAKDRKEATKMVLNTLGGEVIHEDKDGDVLEWKLTREQFKKFDKKAITFFVSKFRELDGYDQYYDKEEDVVVFVGPERSNISRGFGMLMKKGKLDDKFLKDWGSYERCN